MTQIDYARYLGPLAPYMEDPAVMEILIDSYQSVCIARHGRLEDVPSPFEDEEQLLALIANLADTLGRKVDQANPIVDLRLPDLSRIHVVLPPIATYGPTMAIRKMTPRNMTFDMLLKFGSVDQRLVDFFQACVQGRLNIMVSGGTGSGKTTLLRLISEMISPEDRIILVQQEAWMQFKHKRLVSLETRMADHTGRGAVTLADLIESAVRMRPDRLIMSEAAGGEVIGLLQAINNGHDGSMLNIHATSPRDALTRLETMMTTANPALPLLTIRQQIASALNLIIQQNRLRDGTRKVTQVTEVLGLQGDAIVLADLFEFHQTGTKENGKISGQFVPTGQIPSFLHRLTEAGADLSIDTFTP